jgi:WD40 repeat protein
MASILLLDAIALLKSMIRRLAHEHGAFQVHKLLLPRFDSDFALFESVLADEAATKAGDLYIRSVCFSPDGKYLATGAEDKQIRVSFSRSVPQLCRRN